MINSTFKQRLEVSKKVLYMSLGHEAVKLEAVKLWGCLIFFHRLRDLKWAMSRCDVISILVFYGGLFSRQLRTENARALRIWNIPILFETSSKFDGLYLGGQTSYKNKWYLYGKL